MPPACRLSRQRISIDAVSSTRVYVIYLNVSPSLMNVYFGRTINHVPQNAVRNIATHTQCVNIYILIL